MASFPSVQYMTAWIFMFSSERLLQKPLSRPKHERLCVPIQARGSRSPPIPKSGSGPARPGLHASRGLPAVVARALRDGRRKSPGSRQQPRSRQPVTATSPRVCGCRALRSTCARGLLLSRSFALPEKAEETELPDKTDSEHGRDVGEHQPDQRPLLCRRRGRDRLLEHQHRNATAASGRTVTADAWVVGQWPRSPAWRGLRTTRYAL
jgi:hypothetical protein